MVQVAPAEVAMVVVALAVAAGEEEAQEEVGSVAAAPGTVVTEAPMVVAASGLEMVAASETAGATEEDHMVRAGAALGTVAAAVDVAALVGMRAGRMAKPCCKTRAPTSHRPTRSSP